MHRVDNLERIVIPVEYRKKYGLDKGARIDFIDDGKGITVKPFDSICKLCKAKLNEDSELPLCKTCIDRVVKEYIRNELQ